MQFFPIFCIAKISRALKWIEIGLPQDIFLPAVLGTSIALYVPDSSEGASEPATYITLLNPFLMRAWRNPPIKNASLVSPTTTNPKTRKTLDFRGFLVFSNDSSGRFTIMWKRNNYRPYWISLAAKYKKAGPGKAHCHAPRVTRLR